MRHQWTPARTVPTARTASSATPSGASDDRTMTTSEDYLDAAGTDRAELIRSRSSVRTFRTNTANAPNSRDS